VPGTDAAVLRAGPVLTEPDEIRHAPTAANCAGVSPCSQAQPDDCRPGGIAAVSVEDWFGLGIIKTIIPLVLSLQDASRSGSCSLLSGRFAVETPA